MQYWLLKSEPDVFSIRDLAAAKNKTTHWEGVRNYQARNFLRAMKQGALEFLTKPFRDQDLLDAIDQALRKAQEAHAQRRQLQELQTRLDTLNDGERAVLARVVTGLLNKQIAAQLGVSEITVKVRRAALMRKLQAGSLAELVKMVERLEASRG